MNRRRGLLSFLLLVAALSTPAAGVSRPFESLRLVSSISRISGDRINAERRSVEHRARRLPAAAVVVSPPIHSHPRSTALPPSFFQRPPPAVSLAS
jgi:hypothetical protein